jgi:hypothetical protein
VLRTKGSRPLFTPATKPDERWQFRFNVVGLLLALGLLVAFFFYYGNAFVNFLLQMANPSTYWNY